MKHSSHGLDDVIFSFSALTLLGVHRCVSDVWVSDSLCGHHRLVCHSNH